MAAPIVAAAGKWVAQQVAAKAAAKAAQAGKGGGGGSGGPEEKDDKSLAITIGVIAAILGAIALIIIGLINALATSLPTFERYDAACGIKPESSIFASDSGEDGGGGSGGGGVGGSINIDPTTVPDFTGKKGYFPMKAGTYQLTSGYGPRWGSNHIGKDFGATKGTPIYSIADGIVFNTSYFGGVVQGRSGNIVTIATKVNGDIYFHTYKHMSSNHDEYVKAGDVVKAGQQIGRVGNTGYVIAGPGGDGSHLHLEIWKNVGYKPQPGGTYPPYSYLVGNPAINPDIFLNLVQAGNLLDVSDFTPNIPTVTIPGLENTIPGAGTSVLPAAGTTYLDLKNEDGSALTQEQLDAVNAVAEECGDQPAAGGVPMTGEAVPAGPWGGHENGKIPADALCGLTFVNGHLLRCDAANAMNALNEAYKAHFGFNIPVGDTYRSYEAQVILKAQKPFLAGTPGTSNHGWALAVDFGGSMADGGSDPSYVWMMANANKYGWVNPDWARPGGSKLEPWHWEFTGGVAGDGKTPESAKAMARTIMSNQYSWGDDQYQCLEKLWTRESGWNYKAANPTSSARGIPQTMMSVHFKSNWETSAEAKAYMEDPAAQINWGLNYILGRYATPCKAWAHSEANNWY